MRNCWFLVISYWAGCLDSCRFTKLQSVVVLSTAEAEFNAASFMVQEVIYARDLLGRLCLPRSDQTDRLLSMKTHTTSFNEFVHKRQVLCFLWRQLHLLWVGRRCIGQEQSRQAYWSPQAFCPEAQEKRKLLATAPIIESNWSRWTALTTWRIFLPSLFWRLSSYCFDSHCVWWDSSLSSIAV